MASNLIIRKLLSNKEQGLKNVSNVFRSVSEYGSTCPCHGIRQGLCKGSSSLNNVNNNNKSVSTTTTTSSVTPLIFDMKSSTSSSSSSSIITNTNIINNNNYNNLGRYSSTATVQPDYDYAFEVSAANIRFGKGVTREVGQDLKALNAKYVCVFTDPNLVALGNSSPVWTVCESLKNNGINFVLYDKVCIEPTDHSFKDAIQFVKQHERPFDAFVAVGGGSTMDTAKAANLYTTYPTDNFLEYVNAPIGLGRPIPGPLKPLIAIPTTAGTGSEATGVAVFHLVDMNAKTGISNRKLKPTLGIVDPDNTRTMPRTVAIASGFDQLCHALESFTAIPFNRRSPRPASPSLRPSYQGSNPVADIWALQSLELIHKYLPLAVEDPSNDEARAQVMLGATFAGIGIENAGVHLCHGMSYAVSGMVRDYKPEGYNTDKPMIPHGLSVVLHAPAVFNFTGISNPQRHLHCAKLMGADITNVRDEDSGRVLSDQIRKIMRRLDVPDGLTAVGYNHNDIPALVTGTLPQHRVTKLSPRPVGAEELTKLFEDSMTIY
ncbi:hypothetical protein SAMD00019534_098540 [Acytostelium subglobosum LB1]|uniref:hypothetical protein n=1 Tax=Acytostelium subglobosum LB1 TaxID=1410327 RepID=UPI0006452108|nr:hypothetical protein SAMD00019534_098540 [Acytostelium subglobosum LB1]GAM26679.1 hypothetical protein SAMD00019534_098540 [Acytostelium subglobosum LB1]|eukprot:XP_012750340.1 hypothetical protein SAMD00019534_098540 [Acytostelium subglobosum LB1]